MDDKNPESPPDFNISDEGDVNDAIVQFIDYCALDTADRTSAVGEITTQLGEAIDYKYISLSEVREVFEDEGLESKTVLGIDYVMSETEKCVGGDTLPLDIWLKEHTDTVTVYQSSDTNIEASYLFKFDTGHSAEFGRVIFEWTKFMDDLNEMSLYSFNIAPPQDDYRDMGDWKYKVMIPFLKDNANNKSVTGSREDALEQVRNTIRTRRAYDDVDEAYQSSGVYVENYDDVEDIYVLSSQISQIAEEHAENSRSLQAEIDARGIIKGKTSHKLTLENGQTARFWKLPIEFAEPKFPDEEDDDDNVASVSSRGDSNE